jgi:hypothetical protein
MSSVSFEEYLQLLGITERLGVLGVAGSYSARKTLKLLDTMAPPYKWIFPGTANDIDTNRQGYREMAEILESVRKGNLYHPYDHSIAGDGSRGISSQSGINTGSNHSFPDHIDALIDRIKYGRISSRELLHYLYSQKKPPLSETFNDKVVDLLLVYFLTYSMSLASDSGIKHNDVLDLLLLDTDMDL